MDATIFLAFAAVMLLFVLAATVFWVWSIVDAARYTDAQYQAIGQSKVLWIVVIVVVGALGSLLYVLIPRPKLQRV